ncbi:MAG: hypothetical protein BroJett039_01270 [Chloroflexota bacterium]|nr:MAG: hypothetical protein BroJett039_01270 [Chloroflexota bacterium]
MNYDAERLSPPGPIVPVILKGYRNPEMTLTLPAQLDTGADLTLIPLAVADELQLPIESSIIVAGYDGAAVERRVCLVSLEIVDLLLAPVKVIVAPIDLIILGRDVLNHFNITLKGKELTFEMQAA